MEIFCSFCEFVCEMDINLGAFQDVVPATRSFIVGFSIFLSIDSDILIFPAVLVISICAVWHPE